MSGFSIGFVYLCIFGMYALSFWYGATLVIRGEIIVEDLTISFFGVLIASFSLGTVSSVCHCKMVLIRIIASRSDLTAEVTVFANQQL